MILQAGSNINTPKVESYNNERMYVLHAFGRVQATIVQQKMRFA
jgi:hypothetical protein